LFVILPVKRSLTLRQCRPLPPAGCKGSLPS